MHLNTDEVVDLAEGTRPESSAPHLASCAACRQQLEETRAMLSVAAGLEVPEPSPLFWDHFSARVREAVSAEQAPRRSWLGATTWARLMAPMGAAALAALLVSVGWNSSLMAPRGGGSSTSPESVVAVAGSARELLGDAAGTGEDASLRLVADLTVDMDSETAGEAGLASWGSAEHAVTHLSEGELRELRKLLTQALAHSGA